MQKVEEIEKSLNEILSDPCVAGTVTDVDEHCMEEKDDTDTPRKMHVKREQQSIEVEGQSKKMMAHRYVCQLGHNRKGTRDRSAGDGKCSLMLDSLGVDIQH